MSGLAEHFPEFQVGAGGQVSPVDIDRYSIYQIVAPAMGTFTWGTAEGTSTQSPTFAFSQISPDYPRNVVVEIKPASGSTTGGTFSLTGKNQFGESVSETFTIAVGANGGSAIGTKVFGQFTALVGTIGTCNAGVGTVVVYPATAGTTCLFGLPDKIGGTKDVVAMSFGSTGVSKAVNGGTIGAFVNVAQHAILAPNTLTTPAANLTWINVWYKTTWRNENKSNKAGLTQI